MSCVHFCSLVLVASRETPSTYPAGALGTHLMQLTAIALRDLDALGCKALDQQAGSARMES